MNFWDLFVLLFNLSWLSTGVALVVAPFVAWRRGALHADYGTGFDTFLATCAAVCVVSGVALLLLFGAVQTGDVKFGGVQDGCYHVYWVSGGKSGHTEFDPIQCPAGIR